MAVSALLSSASGRFRTVQAGSVLTSVVRMGKGLGMEVVAEGVKTRNQLDFLRGIGCDMVQGYYFSKPLPEETFTALLARQAMGKEQLPQVATDGSVPFTCLSRRGDAGVASALSRNVFSWRLRGVGM